MAGRGAPPRIVAGEESEDDEPAPAPAPVHVTAPTASAASAASAGSTGSAGTAGTAGAAASALNAAQQQAGRRIVQGEEDEDDDVPPPVVPPPVPVVTGGAADGAQGPIFVTAPETAPTSATATAAQSNLRSSGRQRRLAEGVNNLDRDMATRAPLLIRAVKKPLTALSGGLAKTEKVVQDVSYQFKLFNEDLRELDEALARLSFDILPQHTNRANTLAASPSRT